MKKIFKCNEKYFEGLNKKSKGKVTLIVEKPIINDRGFSVVLEEQKEKFNLHVDSNDSDVKISFEQIAYMIAALVQQKYSFIHFKFEISRQALKDISEKTKAKIKADKINEKEYSLTRDKLSLNLSGGIDSATLYKLCPDLVPVSINFDTPSIEEKFEKKIHTKLGGNIIETNASEFLFPHFSNGYSNLASLFFADKKGIGYAVDGKLMSDCLETWDYISGKKFTPFQPHERESFYGVNILYPFLGFTKAGVYKLLYNLDPTLYNEVMEEWLKALPMKSTARIRLLLDAVITGKVRKVELEKFANTPYNFSRMYEYYLVKKLGIQETSKYIENIPEIEVLTLLEGMSMDFMEKYDREMLQYLPEKFRAYFEKQLKKAGVEFYSEQDYKERLILLKSMENNFFDLQ